MTAHPEEQERAEATRAEKVLALGLVAFLLLGGLWVLDRLGDIPARPDYGAVAARYGIAALEEEVSRLQGDLNQARQALGQAQENESRARVEYEFRREEYRTALDAGREDRERKATYQQALAAYDRAREATQAAARVVARWEDALRNPQARLEEKRAAVSAEYARASRQYETRVLLLRLGYALPVLALAVAAWQALRRRHFPYLALLTSFMAFAVLQAAFLVGSYAWTLFRAWAQLGVSLTGAAITAAGMVALRRYVFSPGRVMRARARAGQCPRCGLPLGREYVFCPECGNRVAESCPHCGNRRPVSLPICPHCGR
ncbi:MAG: zinc ribbon domain-containing protein [Bacillota bacterium]